MTYDLTKFKTNRMMTKFLSLNMITLLLLSCDTNLSTESNVELQNKEHELVD